MKTRLLLLLACASFTGASLTSFAGPLRRGDVAADPAWVIHLDFDALRSTTIGNYIQAEMEKPEAQARLAAFQALVNFDLRTQLHGVTLYGTGTTPEDGVLLVYADFDPERLVTLAKAASDSQSTPYKQSTIYNWRDDKKRPHHPEKARTYAAIQGSRVVFGQKEAPVAKALDVMTGAAAALSAGNTFPALGQSANTSFLQAAARKLDFLQGDANAQVLRLSKLMTLQIGEAQQQISAQLSLEANDEEVANSMSSIINGLVSLMKLQKDKPESVKLGEAMSLHQDGAVVHVSLKLPARDVVEFMKAEAARKAQKKAAANTEQP